ncbi:hypothetical protein DQ04_02461100 [Trypanosoma grayi]|uniref:hypothetical protein n=1 Tax=Trypanosoma grayi TaxID=71804 RepID=UPI0004F49B32|nr:hypothetical protein DQ04_02461100 [Trypanosoma grayi]KEG11595.1 hypothetical protein DQ04_02461100 [Trypanosoma grayi]
MGHSAKITRGGDKTRVNEGRREAKMRAQGAKTHATSAKEALEARRAQKKKSQAIATELRAKAQVQAKPIVTMAPKVQKPAK